MSVQRMSVVNSEKMERLFNAIENRNKDTQIVEQALDEPEKIGLIDSYHDMQKSVGANSMLAGLKKQQYIRKKLNYREKVKNKEQKQAQQQNDGGDGGDGAAGAADPAPAPNTKAYSKAKITKFMKNNAILEDDKTGTIKVGNIDTKINYEDFVEDITTNRTSGQNNLTNIETDRMLIRLIRKKMPVSYIRSTKHKKRYLEIKANLNTFPTSQTPTPSSDTPRSGSSSGLGTSISSQSSSSSQASPAATPKTSKSKGWSVPSWLSPSVAWKTV